jgi:hypothetical protein
MTGIHTRVATAGSTDCHDARAAGVRADPTVLALAARDDAGTRRSAGARGGDPAPPERP